MNASVMVKHIMAQVLLAEIPGVRLTNFVFCLTQIVLFFLLKQHEFA